MCFMVPHGFWVCIWLGGVSHNFWRGLLCYFLLLVMFLGFWCLCLLLSVRVCVCILLVSVSSLGGCVLLGGLSCFGGLLSSLVFGGLCLYPLGCLCPPWVVSVSNLGWLCHISTASFYFSIDVSLEAFYVMMFQYLKASGICIAPVTGYDYANATDVGYGLVQRERERESCDFSAISIKQFYQRSTIKRFQLSRRSDSNKNVP